METGTQVKDESQVITQTPGQDKTFTQDELNHIVANRVKKYADYDELKKKAELFDKIEEANKTELQKAQERANSLQAELDATKKAVALRDLRDEVSRSKGVPANLLTGNTQEECEAQADQILNFAKQQGYPKVKDGGEPTGPIKKATRDQFADWLNSL